jgi:hypothetical protein
MLQIVGRLPKAVGAVTKVAETLVARSAQKSSQLASLSRRVIVIDMKVIA